MIRKLENGEVKKRENRGGESEGLKPILSLFVFCFFGIRINKIQLKITWQLYN